MNAPNLVGVGGVFIDDIVLPTGQTYMGQLGGGVVHALMGAAIWDERPGIVTLTGYDLPPALRERLECYLDTAGLHQLDIPQARAWQLFEADGARREVYRTPNVEPYIVGPQPAHLPATYHSSQAFYLLQDWDGIRAWRAAISGLVLWEPLQQIMTPGNQERLRETLQACEIDIISPNLAEVQAVFGDLPPEDLIAALLDDGARIAALRMGEQGSLVANQATGERYHIAAVTVGQVIDQTGAGNTYCGALLLGLSRGLSLREAAAMGAVSASFCIEQVGVLDPDTADRKERDQRYQTLCPE